jgi:3alpha(or 20beta)-hydroxysteroid dehydrogenase
MGVQDDYTGDGCNDMVSAVRKVAVVTGGASGIGLAVVREFFSQGMMVVVLDTAVPGEGVPPGVVAMHLDVTSPDDWYVCASRIETEFNRCDVLVNCAGISGLSLSVENYPLDRFNRVLEVNVTGTLLAIKSMVPLMKLAGGGAIVNLASLSSFRGTPGATPIVPANMLLMD